MTAPGVILDRAGTLELYDTGRRCSVRNVRILGIHCPKCAGPDQLFHDGLKEQIWRMSKALNGYHSGCDPDSAWVKDPIGTKLQHDAMKSLLSPADACPACDQYDCTGATS